MRLYFLLIRLAAFLGHKKARLLVDGEARALHELEEKLNFRARYIWFHSSSVGEFEQARPIIERLKSEDPRCKILLTFFSPSGYELRKNYSYADVVVYLPFATKSNAMKFLDLVHPKVAVFIKYEFWPAYLKELKRRDIPTYSIAAIFRKGQLFFLPWGKPYLNLLHCFTRIYVQDEASFLLLNRFGVNAVSIAGDTRFDRVSAIAAHAKDISAMEQFVRGHEGRIVVAGSSWPADEELFARYLSERPDVRLVLVPHEIDERHLHVIFEMFKGRYVRYTQATRKNVDTCPVLLVDTIGMLSSIYRYADVAYIGGGFGAGIHNTLEAAVYSIPVVFGPNYYKFREAKGLIAAGAAKSVKTYEDFAIALDDAFARHEELGKLSEEYVRSQLGATEYIYNEIFAKNNHKTPENND